MALQIHIIYHDTDPFPGYILQNYVGKNDSDSNPSMHNRLVAAADADPNLHLAYLPFTRKLPRSEQVKYDINTQMLVPLEPGDVTPKAAYNTELDGLKSNMVDLINSTSYTDVDDIIDTQFADHTAGQRNVLKKITYIALHYGKKVVR